MPIKFRCPHCEQFLGISRARAGAIADCPTCGRTIRVPQLDGRVSPLPPPKLDLKDSRLRNALGALASLESREAGIFNELPESKSVSDTSAAPVQAAPMLELEPLPPAALVTPVQMAADRDIPFVVIEEEPAPLRELASLHYPGAQVAGRSRRQFGPLVLLVAMAVCLASGWLIGRSGRRDQGPLDASAKASINAVAPDAGIVEPLPDSTGHDIQGTVFFAEVTGKEMPDRGARVLVLPLERQGSVKLSHLGYRFGSDPADEQVFRAAVQALGGNVAEADVQGSFKLSSLSPGTYGLLVTSRYQPRVGEPVLSQKARRFLGAYFDRPESLLGTVRFEVREIEVTANANPDLQIRFPVE